MNRILGGFLSYGFVAMWLVGCSTPTTSFIPPTLKRQIDFTLSFEQIIESPSNYQGSIVLVGGEVLSAKRLKDHTRIIVLQLPLITGDEPSLDRTESEGRFIAMQAEFLDPATIPPGTRISVIGEISGSSTELLDEMEYKYPVFTIKHLEIWPNAQQYAPYYYGNSYYPHGGLYYGGFGGLYGPYPYYWY